MKIRALTLALAFAGGTAFAAVPTDSPKAPDTAATASAAKTAKHHKKAVKKHAVHRAKKRQTPQETTSYEPQTNGNDNSRQSRMDEALGKYRQAHS